MRATHLALCAILSVGPAQAASNVYRCIGPSGEIMFSQVACGDAARAVKLLPAQTIGEGLRATESDWLDARSDARRKTERSRPRQAGQTDAAKRKQAYRCRRNRQQLEAVQAERRRGYKAGKGAKLRERAERYQTYLDSFCS